MESHTYRTTGAATTSVIGRGTRWSRRAYFWLAIMFSIGVLAQAVLAGGGMFVGAAWMTGHTILGHLLTSPIPLIPLLLLIFSFTGRLPAHDRWMAGLLLFLAIVQPVVLYMRGVLPLLSVLHPANALLLFVLPLYLIMRVRRVMHATSQPVAPADLSLRTSAE